MPRRGCVLLREPRAADPPFFERDVDALREEDAEEAKRGRDDEEAVPLLRLPVRPRGGGVERWRGCWLRCWVLLLGLLAGEREREREGDWERARAGLLAFDFLSGLNETDFRSLSLSCLLTSLRTVALIKSAVLISCAILLALSARSPSALALAAAFSEESCLSMLTLKRALARALR